VDPKEKGELEGAASFFLSPAKKLKGSVLEVTFEPLNNGNPPGVVVLGASLLLPKDTNGDLPESLLLLLFAKIGNATFGA